MSVRGRFGGIAIAACAAALCPVQGIAQQSPPPAEAARCWTLPEVLDLAVQGDPRVGQAGAFADQRQAEARAAAARSGPQLTAFNRIGAGDGLEADNEFDNRAGLRLSMPLFDFGKLGLARRAAQYRSDSARFSAEGAARESAFEAGQHFLAIGRWRERAEAASKLVETYRLDAVTVDRRLEAGLLKQSEASGIRAEYARARASAREESLRLAQERAALATVLGFEPQCIAEGITVAFLRGGMPPDLKTALDEALSSSPDLAAIEASHQALESDRRATQRAGLPDIAVAGTTAYDFGLGGRPAGRASRIGLDVNIPLFQSGQIRARSAAASAESRAANFAVERRRRELIEALTLSWRRVEALTELAALNAEARKQLEQQLHAVEREYEAGVATLSDVLDARRREYDAIIADIDTRFELAVEQLNLIKLSGRGMISPAVE